MGDLPDLPWLDKTFLLQVIQSVEENKQKLDVLKYSCTPAAEPGIGHLSQLYRLKVDYKKEQGDDIHSISIIVKLPIDSGMVKDFVVSVNGYKNEVKVYQEVLPAMYKLHSCRLTARSFDCPLEDSLILEDLKSHGYRMAIRLNQLDTSHCRLALTSLARFHALSVAIHHHHQPDLIQDFRRDAFFTLNETTEEHLWKSSLSAMLATVEKLEGCERYIEMIHNNIDNSSKTIRNILKPTKGLKVLNHGDASINNILFKYDEAGDVVDAKLVDFQISKYSSFAHDIVYMWWSSANEEVREHHQEEMFEVYRQTLNQMFQELGCSERLSKEDFDCEVKIYSPFALPVMSVLLPVIMSKPDNVVDFNKDQNRHDLKQLYSTQSKNSHYTAILPKALQQLESFGAFKV